jgi:hypothetical protein
LGVRGAPGGVKPLHYLPKPLKRFTAEIDTFTNFSITKTSDWKAFIIPHIDTAMSAIDATRITKRIVVKVVMD